MKARTALLISLSALGVMVVFYAWQPLAEAPLLPHDEAGDEPAESEAAPAGDPQAVPRATVAPRPAAAPRPAPVEDPESERAHPSVGQPPAQAPAPQAAQGHVPRGVAPRKMGPLDAMKTAYESDAVDAQAREAEAELRAFSGTEYVPVGAIRGVRCTRRVCKLDMQWSPNEGAMAYMAVGMLVHSETRAQVAIEPLGEPREDGSIDLAMYVSRAGFADEFSNAP